MHEYATAATPQQVGVSERDGKTLARMVRCIFTNSDLPKFLWGEVIKTTASLTNRAPHAGLKNVTPYKALHNKESDLEHLRVMGARAFVHIEAHNRKLDPHA